MGRARPDASECIERIRSSVSAVEFGYKIQALAAHVLLRLDYQIDAINRSGYPDIVAARNGREFRFEVEAEAFGPRPRQLTAADLASLTEAPNIVGYYALAISFPKPYWVLVAASVLARKTRPAPNILLEALSDKECSAEWTRAYVGLLQDRYRQIKLATFSDLRQMALEGRRL